MSYLLEYNESRGWFHFNYLEKDDFHNILFSYSWRPITIVPDNLVAEEKDKGFGKLLDSLAEKGYPYERVAAAVYKFLLEIDEHEDIGAA